MKKYKLKNKIIVYLCFIFLLLNLCPISIITCDREQNICKSTQIFRLFVKRQKYNLKQIKLNDIQHVVYYKEKSSKNLGIINDIYFGHGVGIELKKRQRNVFYRGEEGDYVIPFYDVTSKTKTEKFVNDFNKFIEDENMSGFYNIHISSLFVILSIVLGFIIFM